MTGMNIELIRSRAREIRESLAKIRTYADQPDTVFMADERNLYTVMHLLLISIEAATSICNHLIAKSARQAAGSFVECFDTLRGLGVLDQALADRMMRMARFRNLLVHRYWNVQSERVLQYAREDLGDLEAFLAAVGRFVSEQI